MLSYLTNLSIENDEFFPDKLKQSVATPLYKKSNSINIDNIRPITLLSMFHTSLERYFSRYNTIKLYVHFFFT